MNVSVNSDNDETVNGIQEVGGSIPPGSTIKNKGLAGNGLALVRCG
jgi:hypothetical protein